MVYEDIGWLDVPVHHIWLVKDIESTQDIIYNGNHMILGKLNCVAGYQIENTPEITFSHLHNNENMFQIFWGH